ncbi:MAG: hypothetical protein ACFCUG_11235 [Thiotrichales bacterium]
MLQDPPFDQPGYSTLDFFVEHRYTPEQCEAFYRWWFDWSKHFVEQDGELRAAQLAEFDRFPLLGLDVPFGARDAGYWAREMDALGARINAQFRPKLDEYGRFALSVGYRKAVAEVEALCGEAPVLALVG